MGCFERSEYLKWMRLSLAMIFIGHWSRRAHLCPKWAKTPLQGSVGVLPAFLWFADFGETPPSLLFKNPSLSDLYSPW